MTTTQESIPKFRPDEIIYIWNAIGVIMRDCGIDTSLEKKIKQNNIKWFG